LLNAPQPRSRLYTSVGSYTKGLPAALLGIGYEGGGVAKLEHALGRLAPEREIVVVPMARVGIYLLLKHLIRKGQKVILSPYTISDVVNMVLSAGGIPLFADIEEGGSCNIDADIVLDLLNTEDNVGAVLVTHFYGLACNLRPILEACAQKGIPVIEDAAQAFGGRYEGQLVGTIGDAGVFSFGLLKNVTGFLGGAIVTRDRKLADAIRAELAEFPLAPRQPLLKKMITGAMFDLATMPLLFDAGIYWLFRYAYLRDIDFFNNKLDTDSNPMTYSNFPDRYAVRMAGIQADIILPQLSRYEVDTQKRVAKARIYDEGFTDVPQVVRPPLRQDGSHIYLYYAILVEERDRLARFMTERLRDVQVSHHRNCASLPCFEAYYRDCPNAEKAARCVIYLPTYPGYRDHQAMANVETVRAFMRESNAWK
jgi:dTDP-4-amino-4,6-dideoxygalactose transaminase